MDRVNAQLLYILVVLLAAIAALFYWSTTNSTFSSNDITFSVDEEFEIAEILITDMSDDKKLEIYKHEDGLWRINNNLFANEPAVEELLHVLHRMRIWQPVSIAESQQVEEKFAENGVSVKVYVNTHHVRFRNFRLFPVKKLYHSFIVGEDAPDAESTFMQKTGSSRVFKVIMPNYDIGLSSFFVADERVWRDPVIIDATWDMISSVQVLIPGNIQESFTLRNIPETRFAFYDSNNENALNIKVETARVERFISSFTTLYYEALLDETQEKLRKEIMFEQPFMIINVELKDGTQITLETFARQPYGENIDAVSNVEQDPNRFYIKVNQGEFALAQYFVFNRILRPLSFFKK